MSSHDSFSVIRYTIELQSPVLATDIMGEPNSAVSLPYLSGSLLRGALIERYLQNAGRRSSADATKLDAGDDKTRRLFFGDRMRFLNAYPFNPNLRNKEKGRALPKPSAWRKRKDDFRSSEDGRETYDFSRKAFDIRNESTDCAFFWREEQDAALFSPPRRLNVHTQRDSHKGRSTKDSGAIYRYEALAAGMLFQALILTTPDQSEEIVEWLKGATLWIGRARRAGYGKVVINKVEQPDYWRESGTDDSPATVEAGRELHIAFTSDVLLRDGNGQATLDPRGALETALDLPTESLTLLPGRSWAESKIVGGFNRKWGLPLPQTVALTSGSVFVYQTTMPIGWEKLVGLESEGIGERRNEGFGRVLVDWMKDKNKDEAFTSYEIKLSPKSELAALSTDERKQAQTMAERILRRRLDEKLRVEVNHTRLEKPLHKIPLHKTQLARLRVVLRGIQAKRKPGDPDIKRLKQYLADIQQRRSAREQFERARVNESGAFPKLLDWVKAHLAILDKSPEDDEKELDRKERELSEKMIAKWSIAAITLGEGAIVVTATVNEKIAIEYALRFVDQVLYRASKGQGNEERK